MGLPDDYILPDNYNEACHLTGDGVVVPAVRFLNVIIQVVGTGADHLAQRLWPGQARSDRQKSADGFLGIELLMSALDPNR